MKLQYVRTAANNPIIRVFVQDSTSTTGAGKTGLSSASTGLNITVMRELDAAAAAKIYTHAGGTTDAVSVIGTYLAPTSGHCKFSEIDSVNLPGVYEIQLEQATFNAADASRFVTGMVQATGAAPCPFECQLGAFDPNTALGQSGDVYPLANSSGVKVATGQLTIKKNVALANWQFPMFSSAGNLVSGLTVTALICQDGASSFTALAGAVSEIGSTGIYRVNWLAAETNANVIGFLATASGALSTFQTIVTQA